MARSYLDTGDLGTGQNDYGLVILNQEDHGTVISLDTGDLGTGQNDHGMPLSENVELLNVPLCSIQNLKCSII